MTKGTSSAGKHNKAATHGICRRCGKHSYFKRKGECSSCGFGKTTRLRKYNWNIKTKPFAGHKGRNNRKIHATRLEQVH